MIGEGVGFDGRCSSQAQVYLGEAVFIEDARPDVLAAYPSLPRNYRGGWGFMVRHAGSATLGLISSAAVFHGQRNLEWTFIKNTPRRLLWRTFASHLLYSAAGVIHYIGRGQGVAAVKGKAAALAGLRPVLAKRRGVQCASRVDVASIERLLTRGWFGLKRAEKDGLQARE